MSDEEVEKETSNGHLHQNNAVDQESQTPPKRSIFRALVQDLSPVWFTWVMNIGLISSLTHICPYQFYGLYIISTILYVIALTLFVLFFIIFGLRLALYFEQTVHEITTNVQELCFTAAMPISFMVLTSLTATIVSNSFWGGHAFTLVAYVMWWISVGWTLTSAVTVYIVLTKKELTEASQLNLAIILPAVATSTTAAEGGLICLYSFDMSSRLAVPVIITSFLSLGIGTFLAILIMALWLQRILSNTWLEGPKQPQLCLLLGPVGQGSTAFLGLGAATAKHFPGYNKGTFLTMAAAEAVRGACVVLALILFGLGVFWMCYIVIALVDSFLKKEAKWSFAWYSTIFPTGTMCTALLLFSKEMDSPTFRVLFTVLMLILTLDVIVNVGYTVHAIWHRRILIVKEDPRLKKGS